MSEISEDDRVTCSCAENVCTLFFPSVGPRSGAASSPLGPQPQSHTAHGRNNFISRSSHAHTDRTPTSNRNTLWPAHASALKIRSPSGLLLRHASVLATASIHSGRGFRATQPTPCVGPCQCRMWSVSATRPNDTRPRPATPPPHVSSTHAMARAPALAPHSRCRRGWCLLDACPPQPGRKLDTSPQGGYASGRPPLSRHTPLVRARPPPSALSHTHTQSRAHTQSHTQSHTHTHARPARVRLPPRQHTSSTLAVTSPPPSRRSRRSRRPAKATPAVAATPLHQRPPAHCLLLHRGPAIPPPLLPPPK